jgi:photosystem II stability/assembly factor-like uncharacterized protein
MPGPRSSDLIVRKSQFPAHHSRATQKDRAVWFYQNVAFPQRDASPAQLEKFWATQIQADSSQGHRWKCIGPTNIAGRVTALKIHPHNPEKWFAGTATGGVWVSTNSGETWTPMWSRFANQNIGALAWMMFNGALTLIAATGEANMSGDSYPGSGVYFSGDEGLTWQPLYSPPFGEKPTIEDDVRVFPRRIGSVASKDSLVAIGSIYLDDSLPAGLYLDASEGQGLRACQFWGERSYNCHSVVFHPQDHGCIYASIEPDGSLNGIWRSPDFGKSWEHLTKGLPSGDQFRRTSLVFAPSDPDVMYALAADRRNFVLGVFRSTNGGKSWREILDGRYPTERQMSYNNTIAVHPRKPECVVWGGMKLYRTDNAGRNWRRITNTQRGVRDYVHGDHHALLWPQDDVILSGNDGGVSVTLDGGRTWTERSHGMTTTMFYDLDVAPTDGRVFGGGTQDNGTLIAGVGEIEEGEMVPAIPGDGAWMVFDPADASNVFACATGFQVFHHRPGKPWNFDGWTEIKPSQISKEEVAQRAFTVMAIDPSTRRGMKTLWAGSNRLWRTDNAGSRWKAVTGSFDGTPISAIEISRARPRLMFVGTSGGGIFRSVDGGTTWSQSLSCSDIPARAITSIQVHPKFPGTVAVTVASTGILSSGVQLSTGKDLPYSHIFRSSDMGDTWEDIDQGQLPNVVFYAAAYQTHPPYQLYAGGDVGVWAEIKDGWVNISGNLPCAVVSDLVYHDKDRTLTAATYGRGVWRIRPGRVKKPSVAGGPEQELIRLAAGLRVDLSVAAPVQLSPADGAVIDDPVRTTVFTVKPVRGAMGYQVEFDAPQQFPVGPSSGTTEIRFQSPFLDGGRWRVWAILPDGLRSVASGWRSVKYTH